MYIPNTDAEQQAMAKRIGVPSVDALFDQIPEDLRLKRDLAIPPALSEMELAQHFSALSRGNVAAGEAVCFLGGGCYDHFVPAVVDVIGSRPEFYTAYTPYQAEASQGTLQVGFEFQTLMTQLTGLEVSNASLYEGATAAVEGILLARGVTNRTGNVVVSETVHPEYRQTLATYFANLDTQIITVPQRDGVTDLSAFENAVNDQTAGVLLQHPNFFGILEPLAELTAAAKKKGAVVVQAFDPLSVGILHRPGDYGVDVAVAEGQSLGTPMSYGGPFLGIFTCRESFVRRIPGRIVGETIDRRGNRCFTLTLQTREQHIRREKATSNICTNQGLLALRAAVYLALMGPKGLEETAALCWNKAHYAAKALSAIPGIKLKFPHEFFKEFVIEAPGDAEAYVEAMVDKGFHAGVPLGQWYPSMKNCLLVAVTEKRTRTEIDALADAWKSVL